MTNDSGKTESKIEAKIEEVLLQALDQDLSEEQLALLEHKVTTVRKIAAA